jgi:MFS family permease
MIYLQKKITYRPLAFIGMIGFVGSYFITTFTSSLIMYLLFYATLAGLFQGVTYMIPFLNCYQYLPNRKGLSSGICMTAYGVGSFLFNWIIVKLVNPDNESPNSNHIFSQKVADKFPVGLRYMCILYLFIGVIGCTLIFQKKSNKKVSKN